MHNTSSVSGEALQCGASTATCQLSSHILRSIECCHAQLKQVVQPVAEAPPPSCLGRAVHHLVPSPLNAKRRTCWEASSTLHPNLTCTASMLFFPLGHLGTCQGKIWGCRWQLPSVPCFNLSA